MSERESPVLAAREGPILELTLNRPERLNAVSPALYRALERELGAVADTPRIRAVLLTGAGRAFSVGADLKAHASDPLPYEDRRSYVRTAQRVNRLLQTIPQPVVAAVNGHAIGGGLEMALSSDYIVVAAEAKLRFPEVSLGTFLGGGASYTLSARVGLAKAKELVLLGEFFTGEEAAAFGLANLARPADEVLPAARRVAEELARRAPVAARLAKRLLNDAPALPRSRALALEARALLRCMDTRDWREGIRAFHEKREPRFTGE